MRGGDELDCRIFANARLDQILSCVACVATAPLEPAPTGTTMATPCGELDVRRNPDADPACAADFPDGFLRFEATLELFPDSTVPRDTRIDFVSNLLRRLWATGIPAVAACDYEQDLADGGGYGSASAPWPGPRSSVNGTSCPAVRTEAAD